jgi:hypothetical protein
MARDQQGLALAGAPESARAFDRAMADYYGLTGDPVGVLKSALAQDPGFALGGVGISARLKQQLVAPPSASGSIWRPQRPGREASSRRRSLAGSGSSPIIPPTR